MKAIPTFNQDLSDNHKGCGYTNLQCGVFRIENTNTLVQVTTNGYLGNPDDPNAKRCFKVTTICVDSKACWGSPTLRKYFNKNKDGYYTTLKKKYRI